MNFVFELIVWIFISQWHTYNNIFFWRIHINSRDRQKKGNITKTKNVDHKSCKAYKEEDEYLSFSVNKQFKSKREFNVWRRLINWRLGENEEDKFISWLDVLESSWIIKSCWSTWLICSFNVLRIFSCWVNFDFNNEVCSTKLISWIGDWSIKQILELLILS